MAGIKNIRDLYKKVGEKGLREVLEKEIRVTEKFDAYRFAFEKNPHNYKIYFYGKNGKAPLSKIDRTVNDLYEQAISYIENLPAEIKRAIPVRHRFGFSWFPNNKPLNTAYDRRPEKGLILTDITVRNRDHDVTRDVKESQVFERWAGIFGVEATPPVFEGRLDPATIDSLVEMAKHDYTLSSLNESSVYTPGHLSWGNSSIEALIFESEGQLFKVADVEAEERKADKRSHLFDILLLDICEHLNGVNISGFKPVSLQPDEAYIEVVSEVFNNFVDKRGKDFLDSELDRPKFLEKSGNFNRAWIKNPKTLAVIESNRRFEYLFTVFLTNLRKPKYPSGLLSEAVVNQFNNKIEEISKIAVDEEYSFLEFNTILRESVDEKVLFKQDVKKEPDVARSLLLLQSFFEKKAKDEKKEPVEAVVCNCSLPTKQLINELESVYKQSGKRFLIFHDESLDPYGVEKSTVERILSRLIEDHSDIFIGYHILSSPTVTNLLAKCGSFIPERITCPGKRREVIEKEIDGIRAAAGENAPNIDVNTLSSRVYSSAIKALEMESQKDFKEATCDSLHPYWTEIKSAFDKHTYR